MQTSYRFLRGCALVLALAVPSQVLADEFKDLVDEYTLTSSYYPDTDTATVVVASATVIVSFSLDRSQATCEVEVSELDPLAMTETVVYLSGSSPCKDGISEIMEPVKEYLGVDGVRFIPLIARHAILIAHHLKDREIMDQQDRDDLSIDLDKGSVQIPSDKGKSTHVHEGL